MDIRIINFSEEKRPADLALYWYQVGLKSSRQQTVSLTGDITDMISQAVMDEWKQALKLLVKQENIKALAKRYPNFMQWIALITAQGPGVALQNEHNLFSDLAITDPYDQVNDRLFVSQARTIVTRKTVFLLPDSSPSSSALHREDDRNEFIRSLYAFLSAGNTSIALAK